MGKPIGGIMTKLNQYEFSIEVDEYIFERFVKDKVNFAYKKFEDIIFEKGGNSSQG